MNTQTPHTDSDLETYRQGLRMAQPPDPVKLAAEKEWLAELSRKSATKRLSGYLRLVGPGYLQSAMTLGGGTAAASLFAGAAFGYELLWVAPCAMLLGIWMLSAVAHQTLSTGVRPFHAMAHFAGKPFAWGWALGALLSSIIWQFAQYSLAAAVIVDMGDVVGISNISPTIAGITTLIVAVALSFLYGTSDRTVRIYERILKYMVWGIVVAFGIVIVKTGIRDWGALGRGLLPLSLGGVRNDIAGVTVIVSGLSAAVGANMLFLYPYSLLARGWGKEHRGLARFDLISGMFLPYALATCFMVIATANTIYLDESFSGTRLAPVDAARSLADVVGLTFGRVIFNLGVLGMALSSITLQMLCAGFIAIELFGWPVGSAKYRLATLLPIPGVLGAVMWKDIAVWVAVPTNIFCGLFLPLAYLGFIKLQANKNYLGDDTPQGWRGRVWITGMLLITFFLIGFLGWYAITKGPDYFENFTSLFSNEAADSSK